MEVDINDFMLFNSRFRQALIGIEDDPTLNDSCFELAKNSLNIVTQELLAASPEAINTMVESMSDFDIFVLLGKIGLFQTPQGLHDEQMLFTNLIIDYIFDEIILMPLTRAFHQLTVYFGYLLIDMNNYFNENLLLTTIVEMLEKILYLFLNHSLMVNDWINTVNDNHVQIEKHVLKTDLSVLGISSLTDFGLAWKILPFYSIARNHLSMTNSMKFFDVFIELVRHSPWLLQWCIKSGEVSSFLIERTSGFLDLSGEGTGIWVPHLVSIINKAPEALKTLILNELIDLLNKLYFSQRHLELIVFLKLLLFHKLHLVLKNYIKTFVFSFLNSISLEDGNDLDFCEIIANNESLDLFLELFCQHDSTTEPFVRLEFDLMLLNIQKLDQRMIVSEFSNQLVLFDNFTAYYKILTDQYLTHKLLNSLLTFFVNDSVTNYQLIRIFKCLSLKAKGSISIFNDDFLVISQFLFDSYDFYLSTIPNNYEQYILFVPIENNLNLLSFKPEYEASKTISLEHLLANINQFELFYVNTFANMRLKQQFHVLESNAATPNQEKYEEEQQEDLYQEEDQEDTLKS